MNFTNKYGETISFSTDNTSSSSKSIKNNTSSQSKSIRNEPKVLTETIDASRNRSNSKSSRFGRLNARAQQMNEWDDDYSHHVMPSQDAKVSSPAKKANLNSPLKRTEMSVSLEPQQQKFLKDNLETYVYGEELSPRKKRECEVRTHRMQVTDLDAVPSQSSASKRNLSPSKRDLSPSKRDLSPTSKMVWDKKLISSLVSELFSFE